MLNNITPTEALIYCRVSSQRQVIEGNGLDSQEKRCRDRAQSKGYRVVKVFGDAGISGALFDRPAMHELMEFLDQHSHKRYVIIFDDLKRFARDYQVHLKLKLELVKARGAILECLNFNFEGTPEGEFIEGVLALQGELERKQNRRQVIQKQKARLERGYWPFCPPQGLKSIKHKTHGKILVPKEPFAEIYKAAIEGYANNLFNSYPEVRDFIALEYKKRGINRPISKHGAERILKNFLYAGYIEYPDWEVPRRDGQHQGFISKEVFARVEAKLAGKTKPKLNKTFSVDFPLRRFVTCSFCGTKLTASWNKGRSNRYPNYWCPNKNCPVSNKVTKAWDIHPQFEKILSKTRVNDGYKDLTKAIFMDAWQEQERNSNLEHQNLIKKLGQLDTKIDNLTERIGIANNNSLIKIYEDKLTSLSQEKEKLEQVSLKPNYSKEKFGSCLNQVYQTLENPLSLWNSDNLEDRRTVLYMYFEDGLSFDYYQGFGSVKYSDAIDILCNPNGLEAPNVEMAGNEPASVNTIFNKHYRYSLFSLKD